MPTFFRTPAAFRKWLASHHATSTELWVGYYKRDSGIPGITWPESVDEALCFGWIDGIRKGIDGTSYTNRFTPRKRSSTWSSVNISKAEALIKSGQMQPAGLAAYQARKENRSGIYSYEQRTVDLPEPFSGLFKKNNTAWTFFQAQRPSYRKQVGWWIVSARKDETRMKRLERVMAYSAQGQALPEATPAKAATNPRRPTRG